MLTTTAYAEQVTAGDTGWWRRAVRHAAGWTHAQHPVIDLDRLVPLPQLMVQATALVVYGLARSRNADPRTITAAEVLDWVARRQLPDPPELTGPIPAHELSELADRVRLWRHDVDDAAEQQLRDLAALLGAAGHPVPARGYHSLEMLLARSCDRDLAGPGRHRTTEPRPDQHDGQVPRTAAIPRTEWPHRHHLTTVDPRQPPRHPPALSTLLLIQDSLD